MIKRFSEKILCLILIILLISLMPLNSACSDGYELVLCVRYTLNGVLNTAQSTAEPYLDDTKGISEAEYKARLANAGEKYLMTNTYFREGITLSKTSKTISSYYGLTQKDIGCTLIWQQNIGGIYYDYYKTTFNGWYYSYVYVKVIDNDIISIHFGNIENATTYKVTSYQLFYFE